MEMTDNLQQIRDRGGGVGGGEMQKDTKYSMQ